MRGVYESLADLGVTMAELEKATAKFTGRERPLCGRCCDLKNHEPRLQPAECERIIQNGVVYYTGRCRPCREYEQREWRAAKEAAPLAQVPARAVPGRYARYGAR